MRKAKFAFSWQMCCKSLDIDSNELLSIRTDARALLRKPAYFEGDDYLSKPNFEIRKAPRVMTARPRTKEGETEFVKAGDCLKLWMLDPENVNEPDVQPVWKGM